MQLHINRHILAKNRKDGKKRPVYAIRRPGYTIYAHGVTIRGTVRFVDPRSDPPLSCGATIYAEIEGAVEPVDPCRFTDIEP
jgi:hypothetical protein